ncbi:hypothetical protein GCM10027277_53930 [Pseudoduganella ginsengisoli]
MIKTAADTYPVPVPLTIWSKYMTQQTQPTKEQVRLYMEARQNQQCPPPSIPEIRRQLGWGLTQALDSGGRREGRL